MGPDDRLKEGGVMALYGTNYGHGHVWDRPDGMKQRCGGPGICGECGNLQALFDAAQAGKPSVVSLQDVRLDTQANKFRKEITQLRLEIARLKAANERYASALDDKAHLLLAPKVLIDGVQEIAEAIRVLEAVNRKLPYSDKWERLVNRVQGSIASLLVLQQRLKLSTDVNINDSGGQPSD